jgi:hypothetical protein
VDIAFNMCVQRQAGDDPLFIAVLPIAKVLTSMFFSGRDPMFPLVFVLPLMLLVPAAVGGIVGLAFSVLSGRFSG